MTRDSTLLNLTVCCALVALSGPVTAADRLGRLFFTPEERATLDAARMKKSQVNLTTDAPTEKPPAPPAPEVVTYGGLVRRSDGNATIWLNDRAIHGKDVRAGASVVGKVRPDGSVTLHSQQSGRSVDLRVGQRAELLSGTIEEGYARRPAVEAKPEAKADTKPAAKAAAGASMAKPGTPELTKEEREERERRRDMEDAVRALREATESAKPPAAPSAPTPQAQSGQYPQVQIVPSPPAQPR